MKANNENIEVLIKQSMTSRLTDEEMSMPDIEEEMKRIEELANSNSIASITSNSSNKSRFFSFRKVAASVAAVLIISGVAYASVKYGAKFFGTQAPKQEIVQDTVPKQQVPVEEEPIPAEIVFDNSYLAEMLDTISGYYDMKVVFANDNLKVIRLYYTFNPAKSIDKAIRDLNHFNKMSIRREDSVIYVNPKQ